MARRRKSLDAGLEKAHVRLTVNGEAQRGGVRAAQDAARGAARGPEPHRHQARLRARRVRRLRGARRRPAGALVPGARPSSARAATIETVEGMARDGGLHPLQEAFADLGAAQCGYCTPGHPADRRRRCSRRTRRRRATRSARRSPGNLCRCTGYTKILEAVELAAAADAKQRAPGHDESDRASSIIGKPLRRVDAVRAKVTGADQVRRRHRCCRGCCTASSCAARTPARAHRVASTPRAPGRCPASYAVLTGRDLPDPVRHPAGLPGRARALRRQGALSSAIRSPRSSRSTRRPRPSALDADRRRVRAAAGRSCSIEEALAPTRRCASTTTATRQRPQGRGARVRRRRGSASPRRPRVRETSSSSRATRTCRSSSTRRSPHCGPDGKLTLWSSTQTPHYVHRALAKVLEHAGGAHPRHRHAERRRLRRQERSVQPRDRRRASSRSSPAARSRSASRARRSSTATAAATRC